MGHGSYRSCSIFSMARQTNCEKVVFSHSAENQPIICEGCAVGGFGSRCGKGCPNRSRKTCTTPNPRRDRKPRRGRETDERPGSPSPDRVERAFFQSGWERASQGFQLFLYRDTASHHGESRESCTFFYFGLDTP